MAKKKRRPKHRTPIAPPVHSAPQTVHGPPPAPPPPPPSPVRPEGAGPPSVDEQVYAPPPAQPRPQPQRPFREPAPRKQPPRRSAAARRQRQRRIRNIGITTLVIIAIVGLIAFQKVQSNKAVGNFTKITAAAGCGDVQTVSGLDRTHEDNVRIKYKTSPPSGGPHNLVPLGAQTYDKPFSRDPTQVPNIYQAVHSLEHGYVIVWYRGLKKSQIDALDGVTSNEREVILAPYPKLKKSQKMALTAWGRLMYCTKPDPKAVTAFIDRYRDARSAPEYFNS